LFVRGQGLIKVFGLQMRGGRVVFVQFPEFLSTSVQGLLGRGGATPEVEMTRGRLTTQRVLEMIELERTADQK